MVTFPNGKINIGLHVTRKRKDGFHDIQTIFYPVDIKDALEVIEQGESGQDEIVCTYSGYSFAHDERANICVEAYYLMKDDFPFLPAVRIHLHKKIPIGAGLGGGSADGCFMLQLLNDKFNLGLSNAALLPYALKLGSDCSFFLMNKPCYATGRGEVLEEIHLDLSGYKILLINPAIHVNTGWAFSQICSAKADDNLIEMASTSPETWKEIIRNDFEEPLFINYPEIKTIKERLYTSGAIYASMSGSGSTVFGIFKNDFTPVLKFPSHYFNKWA